MIRNIRRRVNTSPLGENLGVGAPLEDIYVARGVTSSAELDLGLEHLAPPSTLMGAKEAACELADAIAGDFKILIVGDFDADGATGTALAVQALKSFGARNVDYIVPNRFDFGYGLTPEIVDLARKKNPKLIVTVDNGISSIDGVTLARKNNINVIITDHHLPALILPPANVIVNPNQSGCDFISKNLAGVGVIFYVMLALRSELRERQWFITRNIKEPNLAVFLDLVALGTIADVVSLDYNNRILVEGGLRRIRQGKASPGISSLINISCRDFKKIVSSDLGFALGPRLNAAGRLDDMSLGIECLLSSDSSHAKSLSIQLDKLNRERRNLQEEMTVTAEEVLKKIEIESKESVTSGIVIYDCSLHEGIIGIVAGRIKEKFHQPTFVFADSGMNSLKGSGRSIPGLHIRDVLELMASRNDGLITKFGGHAMAAGLTLYKKDLDKFRESFQMVVEEFTKTSETENYIESDGEFNPDWFELSNVRSIQMGGPWGQGFPAPFFDGRFKVLSSRVIGGRHLKLNLEFSDCSHSFDAIAFNIDSAILYSDTIEEVEIVYRLEINSYRRRESIQAVIEQISIVE